MKVIYSAMMTITMVIEIFTAIVSSDAIKIIDDELHEVLVKPLPAGCRLTVRTTYSL